MLKEPFTFYGLGGGRVCGPGRWEERRLVRYLRLRKKKIKEKRVERNSEIRKMAGVTYFGREGGGHPPKKIPFEGALCA